MNSSSYKLPCLALADGQRALPLRLAQQAEHPTTSAQNATGGQDLVDQGVQAASVAPTKDPEDLLPAEVLEALLLKHRLAAAQSSML